MSDRANKRTPSAIGKANRLRGMAFERKVAAELHALTGVRFKRRLDQVRARGLDDLEPDDPAWPLAMELKSSTGRTFLGSWRMQAEASARTLGRFPCIIYRLSRGPIRASLPIEAVIEATGGSPGDCAEWCELTLDGLAYVAREMMARRALAANPWPYDPPHSENISREEAQ